jgi:hypothetical protein
LADACVRLHCKLPHILYLGLQPFDWNDLVVATALFGADCFNIIVKVSHEIFEEILVLEEVNEALSYYFYLLTDYLKYLSLLLPQQGFLTRIVFLYYFFICLKNRDHMLCDCSIHKWGVLGILKDFLLVKA